MKFFEHVDEIIGTRDRVVCGPQRPLTEEEMTTFENEVYMRTLTEHERHLLNGLCHIAQYAIANQEAGVGAIETTDGHTTVEWLDSYTNDRHQRLLGTHPALVER